MKKIKFVLILFILVLMNSFAFSADGKTGALAGEKNLKVVQTQWFDIIYPERSELSASILYDNADKVYEEIALRYGMNIPCRLPVVITPAVEIDNAYFNTYPYNRIVIYDTAVIDDLNVFSNTLLSTFKHELVHAYTYNIKNGFWKFMSFFSDGISFTALTVSPGMAEGATVSTESATGEGRMNDAYALQMVRQAKIENTFPRYAEVRGSRDAYPYGSFYYFTGAFHTWLQNKYGMEKYAKYWYRCVNNSLSNNSAFFKTYFVTMKSAWKDFMEDFYVPDIYANPVKAGEVKDFFKPEGKNYSAENNSGSLYKNLQVTEKGIFFTDNSCIGVYFVSSEDYKKQNFKPKEIFTEPRLYDFTVSADGKYMIVTIDDEGTATSTLRNVIYSFDGNKAKKIYTFSETGYFNNSILQKDGKYYVFANRYENSEYTITATELKPFGNSITLGNSVFSKKLPIYCFATDFVPVGNDKFAYILKDELDFSICICDFDGNEIVKAEAPVKGMKFRDLSYDKNSNRLLFSWATKDTMPRFGMLNCDEMRFSLSKKDISGGVYKPNAFNGDLIYTGVFYRENRIFVKDNYASSENFDDFVAISEESLTSSANLDDTKDSNLEAFTDISVLANNYNQFAYYKKGIFIPLPAVNFRTITTDGYANSPFLGCKWITSNPWGADNIEIDFGTSISKTLGKIAFTSGTDTSALSYSLASQSEFDFSGWRYSDISGSITTRRHFGKNGSASIWLETMESYGRYSDTNPVLEMTNLFYFDSFNRISTRYSNIYKRSSSMYGWKGFSIAAGAYYEYTANKYGTPVLNDYDVQVDLSFYLPKLLPFKNKVGVVTNLPFKLDISLFPPDSRNPEFSDSIFIKAADSDSNPGVANYHIPVYALQIESELVLYAKALQCSFDWMPVFYFNDIRFSLCARGGFEMPEELEGKSMKIMTLPNYPEYIANGSSKFSAVFALKAICGTTLNFGNLCNLGKSSLCFEIDFAPINRKNPVNFFRSYVDMEF